MGVEFILTSEEKTVLRREIMLALAQSFTLLEAARILKFDMPEMAQRMKSADITDPKLYLKNGNWRSIKRIYIRKAG